MDLSMERAQKMVVMSLAWAPAPHWLRQSQVPLRIHSARHPTRPADHFADSVCQRRRAENAAKSQTSV